MAKELNGRAPDAGTPLLEVKDLEVVYKTDENVIHAVNGISFSLNERETIGLVGETGAGKSTTALSILRLLPERTGHITNGEILFRGENLSEKESGGDSSGARRRDFHYFSGSYDSIESGSDRG